VPALYVRKKREKQRRKGREKRKGKKGFFSKL
jgi:hypothetical protein